MKRWYNGIEKLAFKCKEVVSLWALAATEGFVTGFFVRIVNKVVFAAFTCIFASGGAIVGVIVGAMKGNTTETGFLRGSTIGAVSGAITAVQLVESMAEGEPLLNAALLDSLVDGKVFMEWVSPAVLKAYQWQVSTLETTYREISDIYDTNGATGLPQDCIHNLPQFTYQTSCEINELYPEFCCSICLQGFKNGVWLRKIPNCDHIFHLYCLDKWLSKNGSCPICRNQIYNEVGACN